MIYTTYCSECKKPCDSQELDYGIGGYEFWGAPGVHTNIQEVSVCCEGDLWTHEDLENWESEQEESPA